MTVDKVLLVPAFSLALAACGGAAPPATPTGTSARASSQVAGASTSASPKASESEESEAQGKPVQLGQLTFNNHGTDDLTGKSQADLEADDFYFDGTFLRGSPGQKITLKLGNEGKAEHNFSVESQRLDMDVQPGASAQVQVTFPQSGALLFFCKYHHAQGMEGELLTGNASPQAVAPPSASGGAATTAGATTSSGNSPRAGSGY